MYFLSTLFHGLMLAAILNAVNRSQTGEQVSSQLILDVNALYRFIAVSVKFVKDKINTQAASDSNEGGDALE